MFIRGLMSGGAFWHVYAPPSLCWAEGDGDAGATGADLGADAGAQGGAEGAETGASGAQGGGNLSSLAEDTGGEPAAPADWPSDWRERLAGNNEGFTKLLKRFASPENFARSYTELRQKVSTAPAVPTLPENATPEQVAEYRKAIGIPESPDGYGVAFSPEIGADEKLDGMLKGFLAYAHERAIPPAAVKAAVEWQQGEILRQREEATAAAQRERARIQAELRKEYGAEYKRNLALADEFLEAHPGLQKLVNPGALDLESVRDIIRLARETASEDALYSGDGDSGGKSLDEQVSEFVQKSIRGKLTPAEESKYNRLLAAQQERNAKRERSRAA